MIKEHTNKIIKDTLLIVISNLVNYAGTFIIAVFISRFLGVEALGEFTFIFAFSAVFSVITDFGFSTLLIRKINENRELALRFAEQINRFKFTASFTLIVLLFLAFFLFSNQYFNPVFAAGILIIVPKAFQATYDSAIRALLNQKLPAFIRSINSLVQLFIAYFLFDGGYGLWELFVMLLLTESVTSTIFWSVSLRLWKPESAITVKTDVNVSFRSLFSEALPFFGSNVLSFSIPRITAILLGYLASASALGVFSAASRFAGGIGLLSGALFNSYYPVLTQKDADPIHKYKLTKKLLSIALTIGAVITVVLYLLADFLIGVSFKIPESIPVLKIMSFYVIPVLAYTVLQSYMLSIHKENYILKLHAILWILNIGIGIFLINSFSFTGAAIITVAIEYLFFSIVLMKFYRSGSALKY